MDYWAQCDECVFASNSPKQAAAHITDSGHAITEETQ